MTVFNGTVDSIEKCVLVDATNGTDCIVQCGKKPNCLLSFMDVGVCYHCFYGDLSSVTREDSKNMIALKITSSLSNLVRTELLPSLFSFFFPSSQPRSSCPYGIIHLKTCEDGWKMFRRNNNWACLKVVFDTKNMTQPVAKQACKKQYADIGGLETREELEFAAAVTDAKRRSDNSSQNNWAIWINGEMKEKCKTNKKIKVAYCNGTNAFTITDPTVHNKAGYIWSDKEPNGWNFDPVQDCVIQLITRDASDHRYGKLDDLPCNDTKNYDKKGVWCVKNFGLNFFK